jgi:hypothetical protein
MKDVAQSVKPPRSVFLKFPFGSPLGKPGDAATQTHVLKVTEVIFGQYICTLFYLLNHRLHHSAAKKNSDQTGQSCSFPVDL